MPIDNIIEDRQALIDALKDLKTDVTLSELSGTSTICSDEKSKTLCHSYSRRL